MIRCCKCNAEWDRLGSPAICCSCNQRSFAITAPEVLRFKEVADVENRNDASNRR